MASKLNRIYVGAIVRRDLEIFEQIRRFSKLNYNLKIINLISPKKEKFSVKYFLKKIKKYPISLLIVKLFSEESNEKIYDAIEKHAPNIPRLNAVQSVKLCESRKSSFKMIDNKCKKLIVPRSYYSLNCALEAIDKGIPLIIKLDTHNSRNLSKFDRILGVARTHEEFIKIIKHYGIQNNVLFFQEYLGKFDDVYKVYVIDKYVQTITSKNLLQQDKLSPVELIHMRVGIEPELKRQILRLGRKFGMSIYGLDYILKDGVPYVIDINDFPSFRNIPESISLIAGFLHNTIEARQKQNGKLPMKLKVKTYMA